ncbi:hypothetical protein [Actinoplanes sp. NPDC049265]|uniref:hypothetical protein n=1 Tax=Actinoplanes sp. NPDC049265 TaxID=3363902 RepID=UPI0037225DE4
MAALGGIRVADVAQAYHRVAAVDQYGDTRSMTVVREKRWVIGGVALGAGVFTLGGLLLKAGLEQADQWASVGGLFLNIIGILISAYGIVQSKRSSKPEHDAGDSAKTVNKISDGRFGGPTFMVRDMDQTDRTAGQTGSRPASPQRPPGDVENWVEGGTFDETLIMGRDVVSKPPSRSRDAGSESDD